jgi:hypothetical protein
MPSKEFSMRWSKLFPTGPIFCYDLSEIEAGLVRVTQKSLRAAKNHARRFGKAADLSLVRRYDPFRINRWS